MIGQLNGETRLFPIIGDPVAYVESPRRLTHTFGLRRQNAVCVPLHVTREDLGAVMKGLAASRNVDGILVTMPHKFEAFEYCATSSGPARLLRAVSVIRRNPDRTWHGDMLDGVAFVKAQRDRGARIEGARALLVGAGAAGRAIGIALLDAGVRELVVADASPSRAAALLNVITALGDTRAVPGPPDPTGCDLVFNATPMGMEQRDRLSVDAALLRSSMFVGDVIAGHGVTPFVRAARHAGCMSASGDDMVEAVQNLMADFLLGSGPLRESGPHG